MAVTDALGHPTAFAPALPALTRYKKDVVEVMRKAHDAARAKVGRCRLTGSKPVLKAPMVSVLGTSIS